MSELSNHTRLFKNVKMCKNLNWQEKAILSEIISYQLDRKSFKLKDQTLAMELGMDKGTISKLINRLSKRSVINKVTVSFPSLSGGKPKRQRTVTVNEITQWTEGNKVPEVKAVEPKPKKAKTTETPVSVPVTPRVETEGKQPVKQKKVTPATSTAKSTVQTEAITIDTFNDVDNTRTTGNVIINKIKNNEPIEFVKVIVKFDSDSVADEAMKIPNGSNKYFLKSTLMRIDANIFDSVVS